ncbi:MAG: sulfotransferase [Cyanobacteria bacterium J06606_4]
MVSQPVFLVGSERSGTTLLRLMLNFHPEITWLNEFEYAVAKMDEKGNYPNLQDYYSWLETHRIFQMSGMGVDKSLTYPQLVDSFLQQRKDTFNKALIGATVHYHFDRLLSLWPDARFIHIVRDPRDVSHSCMVKGWAGNVWIGLERWIQAEALWERFSKQLPVERKLEIVYKDLIANNTETLEKVCDFIGVAYSEKMLDYVHTTDYGLPDPKLVSSWRRKLSDREIQYVEARVGEQMVQRGFELSGLPKVDPSPLRLAYFQLQNKINIVRSGIKYYGLKLYLADFVARRLNISSLKRSFQLEKNQIELSRLKKSW